MADLLTELFGSAIAGGLSGAMRGNREEALLEERALAALLKEGKGYIPEQLLPFMEGYTRYPPEESQPFPWAEGESRVAPGRRWTYAESAKAKAERGRTEGYEKKLAEMPEHDFYNYLRKTLKYAEGESEDLTKKIFEIDELPWIKGEEPTAKQEMTKQEKILWDMFKRGDFTAENYKENLSKFAQRRVEEMKLFPEEEKPEKPKALDKYEEIAIYQIEAKKGLLKNPYKRQLLENAGIDPDTGEEMFDVEASYKEYQKWKEELTADRRYRKDPQTGKLLDIEKTDEELMEEFRREREQSLEMMKKTFMPPELEPQTKTDEDKFIVEIKSKNITTIHWDKIKKKYPNWDIGYIKQQLGM